MEKKPIDMICAGCGSPDVDLSESLCPVCTAYLFDGPCAWDDDDDQTTMEEPHGLAM